MGGQVTDRCWPQPLHAFPRQALHAWRLGFVHPVSGARLSIESPPPADLQPLLNLFA